MHTCTNCKRILTVLFGLLFSLPATAQLLIDDFNDEHETPAMTRNISANAAILGGEREVDNSNNAQGTAIENGELTATLAFFNSVRLVYDGEDGDTDVLDYQGLGGLDIAGLSDAFVFDGVHTLQAAVMIDVAIYSSEGQASFMQRVLDPTLEPVDVVFPFSDFEVLDGEGADFSQVGAIEIVVSGNGDTFLYTNSIGFTDTALPVELISFTGIGSDRDVELRWETASERNNAGFVIEHMAPQSTHFEEIAFIEGYGTTDQARRYQYSVYTPSAGRHLFRLKQIDFDGAFEYSETIEFDVQMDAPYQLFGAYPNPFNPTSAFLLTVSRSQHVQITLHNILGQQVSEIYAGPIDAQSQQQFSIDGAFLPSGTYLYRVEGEYFEASGQVLLVK